MFLAELTGLQLLDISFNRSLDPGLVRLLTGLRSLSMQVIPPSHSSLDNIFTMIEFRIVGSESG